MKQTYKLLTLAILTIISINVFSQAPAFYHPTITGSNIGNERVVKILGDGHGNTYVTGTFTSDSIRLGNYTLVNDSVGGADGNTADIFIAKYDSTGNVLWAQSAQGKYNDTVASIALDNAGNVWMIGYLYSPQITFPGSGIGQTDNTGATSDIFIQEFTPSGTDSFATVYGGTGIDVAKGIVIDHANNVYITGNFASQSINFYAGGLNSVTLNNSDASYTTYDIFYAQLSLVGTDIIANWAHSALGPDGNDCVNAIALDTTGNVFITGSFESSGLVFQGNNGLTGQGIETGFVAKINSSGTTIWSHWLGSGVNAKGSDLVTDIAGNIYVSGGFNGATFYDDASIIVNINNHGGGYDIFLVKYNSGGIVTWATNPGADGDEIATAMSIDNCGYIYVLGYFSSNSGFTFGSTTGISCSTGVNDVLLLKYDGSSNELWAKTISGPLVDEGTAISGSINDNVIVAAYTNSISVTMDSNPALNNSDASGYTYDFILAKVQTTSTDIFAYVYAPGSVPVTNGKVVLYARLPYNYYLHHQDSLNLDATGSVHFANVLNLNYFMEATADTSLHLIPTYNGPRYLWDSIVTWQHTCRTNDTIQIHMPAATNSGTGICKIKGKVVKGPGFPALQSYSGGFQRSSDPVPGADVKLGHHPGGAGSIVASTTTDTAGNYTFNNIDPGGYQIFVDIPGLGRDSSYVITVNPSDTLVDHLDYTADSNLVYIEGVITKITSYNKDNSCTIYPNPFTSQTTISFNEEQKNTSIKIMDMLGNEIKSTVLNGTKTFILEKENMQPGMYFVQIIDADKNKMNGKIVVQ